MSFLNHPGFTSDVRGQLRALNALTIPELKAVAKDYELDPDVNKTAARKLRTIRRTAKGLPFAWDIEVEFSKTMIYTPGLAGNWKKTFHYKEISQGQACRRAMLKPHAQAVTRVDRIETEEQYRRCYGNWEEKGL